MLRDTTKLGGGKSRHHRWLHVFDLRFRQGHDLVFHIGTGASHLQLLSTLALVIV